MWLPLQNNELMSFFVEELWCPRMSLDFISWDAPSQSKDLDCLQNKAAAVWVVMGMEWERYDKTYEPYEVCYGYKHSKFIVN